jgi:hypothetical protein
MKRQAREQLTALDADDEQFARAALGELRAVWKKERRTRSKRARDAANLMRLAAETRELLALWTYYRLACLEAMDSTHLGAA